jgi:putative ABC transport system permease protein
VGRDHAAAELEALVRRLQEEYPRTNAHTGVVVRPLIEMLGGTAPTIVLFLAIIALALMAIACANVANVVLAVASARRQEFAIRRSLGASPLAQVVQLVAEGVALAMAACPLGLLTAWSGLKGLAAMDPGGASPLSAIDLNPRVAAAAAVMALAAAAAFALLPAVRSSRQSAADLQAQSRTTSAARRSRFVSHALVAAQVGIAVILLVQITSFTRTAFRFVNAARGFDEQGILTFRLDLAPARYSTPDAVSRFASNLVARASSLPDVTSVAVINRMPIGDRELGTRMALEGTHPRPEDELPVTLATITEQYLSTMRVPVVRGRGLTADDLSGRRLVGLVSQTAARRYWPGRNPIGTRITVDALGAESVEIVGIVGDVRNSDVDQGPSPQVYVPFSLKPSNAMAVIVRTSMPDPASVGPSIRHEVARLDHTQAAFDLQPMSRVLFEDTAGSILVAAVLGAIGLVALVLAATGVYGLVAYAVTQRTREIGIRVAVGARPRAVVRMVVMHGARPVIAGALLGAAGASGLAVVAAGALEEVDFRDPLNYAVVTIALVAIGLLASIVPARRAARVDPVVALKSE